MKNKYLIPAAVILQYLIWVFITMDFVLVNMETIASFVFVTVIITMFCWATNDIKEDKKHIDKEL